MKVQDKIFIAIGSMAIIATVGFGLHSILPEDETSNSNLVSQVSQVTSTTNDTTASVPKNTVSKYIDGTYTASASYNVSRYSNSIAVTITVKDDIVTDVKTINDYVDRESGVYIDSFENALSSKVVGKNIDDLNLSRVGGASFTTLGFNNALDAIATNAKA